MDEENIKEAKQLLKEWTEIELEDALPLLSIKFAANSAYNPLIDKSDKYKKFICEIRQRAIECLKKQTTETIKLILL